MAISMEDIKALRTLTGAGMMDVKKALEEANGDHEKAVELIRKRGLAIAAKRSERAAEQGCVLSAKADGFAAIVAVKCETDFVAKNADFVAMTQSILDLAMAKRPENRESLLAEKLPTGETVEEIIGLRSGVTGEKMELGAYEFVSGTAVSLYVHPGNMLASVVAFNEAVSDNMGKEIAMQVASMNPVSVDETTVPEEIKARELEIAKDKARQAGKPEHLLDVIAQGSLNKFYEEFTLLKQASILDSKKNVAELLKGESKTLTVTAFRRVNLNQD